MSAVVKITGLNKTYRARGKTVPVLRDVTLEVQRGEVTGLVGESGSGKSTLIRCYTGLAKADSGQLWYDDIDLTRASRSQRRRVQQEVQVVFQDPYSSLDPRMTVGKLVGEGLAIHRLAGGPEARDRVAEALEMVGLDAKDMERYPRSFSGGQRQRIAIARAIVMRPRLLICDEPVSALDVSVQAQVLTLLHTMQRQLELTVLFVAHDLAVVHQLCDRVAVLCQGRIVEQGSKRAVFDGPSAPYTRELLEAIPDLHSFKRMPRS
jgi:ABC-type glutathione transport system ATPase component